MNSLEELLQALVGGKVEKRGRPMTLVAQAPRIDQDVWESKFARGISLGAARRAVAAENGLRVDHVRKLQRIALAVYLDDIVEAQMERQWEEQAEERMFTEVDKTLAM